MLKTTDENILSKKISKFFPRIALQYSVLAKITKKLMLAALIKFVFYLLFINKKILKSGRTFLHTQYLDNSNTIT